MLEAGVQYDMAVAAVEKRRRPPVSAESLRARGAFEGREECTRLIVFGKEGKIGRRRLFCRVTIYLDWLEVIWTTGCQREAAMLNDMKAYIASEHRRCERKMLKP